MTDAEPASSLISAQFQVIIGRQIRVIALTPLRCSLRHLAGYASSLKYNMSEARRPAECSVGCWPASRKGRHTEMEPAKRNTQINRWWVSRCSTHPTLRHFFQ